ncbi:hypothetical protein V7138_13010 [Bacillus sp. JJ1533]|uniref:hypothetical protein n=1 Tax=Bacillus sp. JJ1533 TaxID=3122959 RepID=UPI00300096E7
MRIMMYTLLLLVVLVGCSANNQVKDQEEPTKKNQTEQTEATAPEQEETTKEEPEEVAGYTLYRPEVGTSRTFTNNGEEIFTQEIVAENDEYVQLTIAIGGTISTQVYKWTADEISLVFEEREPSNPSESILDSFTPNEEIDVFVQSEGNSDWELIDEAASLKVPYGEFKDVLVIQKVTDEVEGADTIYTRYFAPSVGMIKESFEVTGEQGYEDEANLETVQK